MIPLSYPVSIYLSHVTDLYHDHVSFVYHVIVIDSFFAFCRLYLVIVTGFCLVYLCFDPLTLSDCFDLYRVTVTFDYIGHGLVIVNVCLDPLTVIVYLSTLTFDYFCSAIEVDLLS